jgi:hypothetical protein
MVLQFRTGITNIRSEGLTLKNFTVNITLIYRVVQQTVTIIPAVSIIRVISLLFCPEDEKKQIPPKCWEQSTKLHHITSVTEVNFSHSIRTSNLAFISWSCGLVGGYKCFTGIYCLYLQGRKTEEEAHSLGTLVTPLPTRLHSTIT